MKNEKKNSLSFYCSLFILNYRFFSLLRLVQEKKTRAQKVQNT